MSDTSGASLLLGFMVLAVLLALYLLPAIIGFSRHHRQATAIFVLDLLLGWTMIGWIAALVWSLTNSQPQQVIYVQGGSAPGVPVRPPETPV